MRVGNAVTMVIALVLLAPYPAAGQSTIELQVTPTGEIIAPPTQGESTGDFKVPRVGLLGEMKSKFVGKPYGAFTKEGVLRGVWLMPPSQGKEGVAAMVTGKFDLRPLDAKEFGDVIAASLASDIAEAKDRAREMLENLGNTVVLNVRSFACSQKRGPESISATGGISLGGGIASGGLQFSMTWKRDELCSN